MTERKLVSFRLPEDLLDELRKQAAYDAISLTELITRRLRIESPKGDPHLVQEQVTLDKRIAFLEEEIQELRRSKQIADPIPLTPLSALVAQNIVHQEREREIHDRLSRLEKMMEQLIRQSA